MNFKPGDRVVFLNEVGGGVVVKIQNDMVVVEDDNGFEMPYRATELIPERSFNVGDVSREEAGEQLFKSDAEAGIVGGYDIIEGKVPFMEVDLHIHQIIDSNRNLSNHEMVQLQLTHFRKTLLKAREMRLNKVVFIHGIGKGRLKEELRKALKGVPNSEFFDADFHRYGYGATEVRLWYN